MQAEAGSSVEFRVLGPVEARRNGRPLPIGGPRQRALLALLLLEPGRPVSAGRLIDEIWTGEPPDGADVTLRSYVSRLRATLGHTPAIDATAGGYSIAAEADHVDARRFERLVREAGAALGRRDPDTARELADEALGLWRGAPFGGLADQGAFRVEAERLEERRLHAIELRLEAALALGEGAALVDELEGLVHEHPYRERLWGQLMLALYRSGRQAEALAAYQRSRAALEEHLGTEPGEELQRLQLEILRHEVPAAEAATPRHNLPAALTTFIGRETELAAIAALLERHRLVTLDGVGGVGKTRLGLEVARRAVDGHANGVWFVDLAPLADPALLASHIGTVLGLREQPGVSAIDRLIGHLRDADALLVLDNCEHLRHACRTVVARLLAASTELRVLATSRELLGVAGEVELAVPPLTVPAPADAEAAERSDAVDLFLERARSARPDLRLGDDARSTVARIVRDLDGLPLAIELAAARARALSLPEIADRLNDRFRFLVSWRRLAPARHATLRAAMDWSYDLLGPDEQRLLRSLSVFAGGFDPGAVRAVCTDGDADRALTGLARLLEASLVLVDRGRNPPRYRLLETVRQYGAALVEAHGERDDLRRRHAGHFRSLLDVAWAAIRVGATAPWADRLAHELDNMRAALTWARDSGNAEELLGLAEGLWYFWWVHGDVAEGRAWLATALDRAADVEPGLRSRGLHGAARLAWAATDFEAGRRLAEQALASMPGDTAAQHRGMVLQTLGVISTALEDRPAARRWLEQARGQFESLPDDDPWRRDRLAGVLIVLGSVDFFDGDYASATARFREALADCAARQDRDGVALCELYIAHVDLLEGRFAVALSLLGSALRHYRRVGWLQYIAECFELIAFSAGALGRAGEAVRLIGAADTLRDRTGNRATLGLARLRAERIPDLRRSLGEAAYAAELEAGRAMSDDEAFAEADRVAASTG